MSKHNKINCWLCDKGYGLDNGDLNPGELIKDIFGDNICIYCDAVIKNMAHVLANPELIKHTSVITPIGIMLKTEMGVEK